MLFFARVRGGPRMSGFCSPLPLLPCVYLPCAAARLCRCGGLCSARHPASAFSVRACVVGSIPRSTVWRACVCASVSPSVSACWFHPALRVPVLCAAARVCWRCVLCLALLPPRDCPRGNPGVAGVGPVCVAPLPPRPALPFCRLREPGVAGVGPLCVRPLCGRFPGPQVCVVSCPRLAGSLVLLGSLVAVFSDVQSVRLVAGARV